MIFRITYHIQRATMFTMKLIAINACKIHIQNERARKIEKRCDAIRIKRQTQRKIGFWYAWRSDKNLSVCDDTRLKWNKFEFQLKWLHQNWSFGTSLKCKAWIPNSHIHMCIFKLDSSLAFIFQFDKGSFGRKKEKLFAIYHQQRLKQHHKLSKQHTHFFSRLIVRFSILKHIPFLYLTNLKSQTGHIEWIVKSGIDLFDWRTNTSTEHKNQPKLKGFIMSM